MPPTASPVVSAKSTKTSGRRTAGVDPFSAEALLTASQANRDIIQDFVPLAESLEWQLGQQYLRERGNKAFISDACPVPFIVNNGEGKGDGHLY